MAATVRWKKVLLVALASLALLVLAIVGAACDYLFPGYCSRLERRARDPEVQRTLEAWVARNWSGDRISPESIDDHDGIVPGIRWLSASFDGSILAMGPDAHVRLLGVSPIDVRDDTISQSVQAISFTDRSRAGVFVQLDGRDTYNWSAGHQTLVSDKVGVVCMW